MSQQDDSTDLSKSLLRRLLNQDQESRIPENDIPPHEAEPVAPDALLSPIPGFTIPAQPDEGAALPPTSPIRPTVQDTSQPQPPLTPSLPAHVPQPMTPREQMQRAEEALINLRQKMAQLAAEFAQGKLNQAQFDAIYSRYSEQRDITERLLTRNPESQAWQSVVRPGHTGFLKEHFEARVLSYAIYDQASFERITVSGPVLIEQGQIEAILTRLKTIIAERGNPGPAQKQIGDGRCVLFVPGTLTVSVVIFSLEPSQAQIQRLEDIHRDFERANQQALRRQDFLPDRLVFPHRALFEERKH